MTIDINCIFIHCTLMHDWYDGIEYEGFGRKKSRLPFSRLKCKSAGIKIGI